MALVAKDETSSKETVADRIGVKGENRIGNLFADSNICEITKINVFYLGLWFICRFKPPCKLLFYFFFFLYFFCQSNRPSITLSVRPQSPCFPAVRLLRSVRPLLAQYTLHNSIFIKASFEMHFSA